MFYMIITFIVIHNVIYICVFNIEFSKYQSPGDHPNCSSHEQPKQ